jgi:ribosome-associated protein
MAKRTPANSGKTSKTKASKPAKPAVKSKAPKAPKAANAPKAPKAPRSAAASSAARALAMELGHLALEKKALDVLVLDVCGLTSYADFLVLMTAESDPQLLALADHLLQKMKEKDVRAVSVEGMQSGRWVVIDFGDVVVHVFFGETREFYDLEGLWADAKRTPIKD